MRNANPILRQLSCATLCVFLSEIAGAADSLQCHPNEFARLALAAQGKNDLAEPSGPIELADPVRRWLTIQKTQLAKNWGPQRHANGRILSVNGVDCEILLELGRGDEGYVYLVKTKDGLRSLKMYKLTNDFSQKVDQLEHHKMRAPRIVARDPKSATVLMEYIEGVSPDEIRKNWQAMGLSEVEKNSILEKWNALSMKLRTEGSMAPVSYNVIYSFRDGEIYVIDTH